MRRNQCYSALNMERYLPDDIVQHIVYWKEVNEAKIEFDNVWKQLCETLTDYELMRRILIDSTGDLDTDLVIVAKISAQRKMIQQLLTSVRDADAVYEAALVKVA